MVEKSSLLCYNMALIRGDGVASVYNEKRYLNGDQEALDFISELREEYIEEVEDDRENYYEAITEYEDFLNELADELLKYDLNDSLEYSIALSYLIDKGYLSVDHKFRHRESLEEVNGRLGMNIVSGRGCCRNIVDFHKAVFDRLNISLKPLYCYEGIRSGSNSYANHVMSLVEYDNNLYGIDLHNGNALFRFKKPMKLSLISTLNSGKVRYKPYYELVTGESDLETIRDNLKRYEEYSKKKAISPLIYDLEIKHRTRDLMKSKKDKLEKFSEKTKVLKKSITDNMPNFDK